MAETTLKFILESTFKGAGVKDASGALKDLTSQAGQTDAALVKTGNGFVALSGASKQAVSALDGLGISTVALTDPMYAAGAALKYSIDQAAEAERIMAQTEAVIKSTGGAAGLTADEIAEMSQALSQVSTFSDDAVQKGANLLLTFTGIGKDVFPEATQAMLDMATAMGTDASSGAIQLGKALNDPTAGISALTRVGVVFTDEQKNLIKSLQDSGDMMGAQRVILAELNKEFGGSAAAAADTYSGKLKVLQNNVDNLAESFGSVLIPVLSEAAGAANTLITWNDKVTGALEEHAGQVLETADGYTAYFAELKRAAEAAGYLIDAEGNLVEKTGRATTTLVELNYALTEEEYKLQQAAQATATLTASVSTQTVEAAALTSVWQSYGPTVSEGMLANEAMRQTLEPLTGAASDLKFGMSEVTSQLIFYAASAGMSDQESLALAQSMGLISPQAASTKEALDQLRTALETGKISSEEYNGAVAALDRTLRNLPDNVPVTVTVETLVYAARNAEQAHDQGEGPGSGGYASGVQNMVIPPGYPNDSYPMRVQSGEVVDVWRSPGERAAAMGGGRGGDTVNIYDGRAMALYMEDKRRRAVESAEALMG